MRIIIRLKAYFCLLNSDNLMIKNSLKIKSLVDVIVKGMQEKKAENVTVVDLRNIDNAVCDFSSLATQTQTHK